MKLSSGSCPTWKLLAAGINLALGTDGAASNNSLNMFSALRTASLLAKLASGDASQMPASTVLEMATLGGAKALGWDKELGSLEAGKCADFIAIDFAQPETSALYDVYSQLVHTHPSAQVTHSWVGGEKIMHQREVLGVDTGKLLREVNEWSRVISRTQKIR